MKRLLIFTLFIFSTLTISSQADANIPVQTDAHILGHVLDKKTQEHLPYVTVKLQDTTVGITTDDTGHYFLRNLPVGDFIMEVSMVGFSTTTKDVKIESNRTLEINFELEESTVSLDELVVSANRNETTRKKAPALVSVLNMKTLEATNSKMLASGLKFQPGLRIENSCQNCGTTQVRINGLEGSYSQILIDSRPIVGTLAGVYGLEHIPANMIERIEVLRGGGSALFGSNAIGGTINVITREPVSNMGEFSHTTLSLAGGKAVENNSSFNSSVVSNSRKVGIMVYGQQRDRGGLDLHGDGFTELPTITNNALGFRSFIKTGIYSKVTMEYRNIHEFRRGGDRLNEEPFMSYITEQAEHYINNGSINYNQTSKDQKNKLNLYIAASHIDRNSYYGAGDPFNEEIPLIEPEMSWEELDEINRMIDNNNLRVNSYGKTSELTYQIGGHYMRSFDNLLLMPADLTFGLEHLSSKLDDISGYRTENILQKANTESGFLQNEWKNDMISILVGGRLDKHSLVEKAIFSPRINFRYNPTDNYNFRLTYSEGFRAPQLFDEDLHVDIAGGEQIVRVLSDNLKEERSKSLSGSADLYFQAGSMMLLNLLIEGFYTKLNNPFTNVKIGNEVIIENATDGAKVYGVNIETRAIIRNLFDFQAGATIQQSMYEEKRRWWEPDTPEEEILDQVEATKRMMRTPNSFAYFVLSYTPQKPFTISLSGNYTGRMLIPHEAGFGVEGVDRFSEVNITKESPRFFELNSKIAYFINIYSRTQLEINCGVQNIFNSFQTDFDTGAGRANNYIYGPDLPRTFFAGLKVIL